MFGHRVGGVDLEDSSGEKSQGERHTPGREDREEKGNRGQEDDLAVMKFWAGVALIGDQSAQWPLTLT